VSSETAGGLHGWKPVTPRFRLAGLVARALTSAIAFAIAVAIVPGAAISGPQALIAICAIAVLNALIPPLIAALRLPFTLVLGFVLVLAADAAMLMVAGALSAGGLRIDSFPSALAVAVVASAVVTALEVVLGTNDDDTYTFKVIERIARRSGRQVASTPGIVFLEIDGLAMPVLQRAMRDGSAPTLAAWLQSGTHHLVEWETDLSSQTGASQAGILLGANDDIPGFRWLEKETRTLMTCSAPDDCAEIERRHSTGQGLLARGGSSRGNLLSGEADDVILTASRIDAEKRSNRGYRAFFANGFNVTRSLVLFGWELALEWTAAARAARRDVKPRGKRGGRYPFIRAAMCVVVRDLIVYGVLTDMMRGVPAIYATFSSYDEVAHHSGLERADTLEALRKLDQQIARIARALPYAARPYEIVVLSDHGQTQGATFKQRNGYGLDDLVSQAVESTRKPDLSDGDEHERSVGHAFTEAGLRRGPKKKTRNQIDAKQNVVVLGSGNLGLVYLMASGDRMTLEEIDRRHPSLLSILRTHRHIGWLLVHSEASGGVVLGPRGTYNLDSGVVEGANPLAGLSPNAAAHLKRTDGFKHVPDIVVGSFFDSDLEEGCAFEELISFHGGLGGPQTRPFLLYPAALPMPPEGIVGAPALHSVLLGWRYLLNFPVRPCRFESRRGFRPTAPARIASWPMPRDSFDAR
jgi:uncharacterized membrane protein YvlD (DUF360 family)